MCACPASNPHRCDVPASGAEVIDWHAAAPAWGCGERRCPCQHGRRQQCQPWTGCQRLWQRRSPSRPAAPQRQDGEVQEPSSHDAACSYPMRAAAVRAAPALAGCCMQPAVSDTDMESSDSRDAAGCTDEACCAPSFQKAGHVPPLPMLWSGAAQGPHHDDGEEVAGVADRVQVAEGGVHAVPETRALIVLQPGCLLRASDYRV